MTSSQKRQLIKIAASTIKRGESAEINKLFAAEGGYARAKALSPERLSEIGKAAIAARWRKRDEAAARKGQQPA